MDTLVVGNDGFGMGLAGRLGCRHLQAEQRIFPDGEACPRIQDSPAGRVILAWRMAEPLDPNRYLVEVLLMAQTLRGMGAKEIGLVMPYMVYSRQDRVFREGEPFSVKHVMKLLADAGVSGFYSVTDHCCRKSKIDFSPLGYHIDIDGFGAVEDFLKGKKLDNPVVVGPDRKAEPDAKKLAEALGAEAFCFDKERDPVTGKVAMAGSFDAKGMDAVIVDDIVSSGSTMLGAIARLKETGPKSITAIAIHNLASPEVMAEIAKAASFFCTDTIARPASGISVVGKVAEALG
jgi:ribose-phosphate pyrophosphokinase